MSFPFGEYRDVIFKESTEPNFNLARLSRCYGRASMRIGIKNVAELRNHCIRVVPYDEYRLLKAIYQEIETNTSLKETLEQLLIRLPNYPRQDNQWCGS